MLTQSPVFDLRTTITATRRISPDVSIITISCPAIAEAARPGNFVNVKIGNTTQPLLRRPFSIHGAGNGCIELMVKEVGKGTRQLCGAGVGVELSVLGPLGNGFDLDGTPYDTAVLVSGGIGTAPMRFLQEQLAARGRKVVNLIGGRTAEDLLSPGLEQCRFATDDGSTGLQGTVVDLLDAELPSLREGGALKVFSCGPTPMLKALAAYCRRHELPCDLSLESVMGCGIGICYGCSVEVNAPEGGTRTLLLCKEGPVIDAALLAAP